MYLPESGEVRLDGRPITAANRESYRQLFSVVFDDAVVFDSLWGLEAADLDQRAREYLAQLELDHAVTVTDGVFSTTKLSRGQRKRLALVTAYLEDRPIYLFDEWAADQDPLFRKIFYRRLLPELKSRGKTVVAVTHDDRYFARPTRSLNSKKEKWSQAFATKRYPKFNSRPCEHPTCLLNEKKSLPALRSQSRLSVWSAPIIGTRLGRSAEVPHPVGDARRSVYRRDCHGNGRTGGDHRRRRADHRQHQELWARSGQARQDDRLPVSGEARRGAGRSSTTCRIGPELDKARVNSNCGGRAKALPRRGSKRNNMARAKQLHGTISVAEYDTAVAEDDMAKAEMAMSEASSNRPKSPEAGGDQPGLHRHRSPVDGVVIDRRVNVDVTDNQFVKKGQPLIHIDPRQYRIDREKAEGSLEAAKHQFAGQQFGAVRPQELSRPARSGAGATRQRQRKSRQGASPITTASPALSKEATTRQDVDAATAALKQAQAQVMLASAQVTQNSPVPQRIGETVAQVGQAKGQIEQAQARLDQADLNLSWTVVERAAGRLDHQAQRGDGQLCHAGPADFHDRLAGSVGHREFQGEPARPDAPGTSRAHPCRRLSHA